MAYLVKETYTTLQGEGANMGRVAVFCRFSGCNLWSGRERDRTRAICTFCDTDFRGVDGVGGGRYTTAGALADSILANWRETCTDAREYERRFVVFTGGEPLLQLDAMLIDAMHSRRFEIAVETNGSRAAPAGIDWLCVSPKGGAHLVLTAGDELKLAYPQAGAPPERFEHLDFTHFYLQPIDGPERGAHTRSAVDYCLAHPRWRLSIQMHKFIGLP